MNIITVIIIYSLHFKENNAKKEFIFMATEDVDDFSTTQLATL